jgi:hypothetical protein
VRFPSDALSPSPRLNADLSKERLRLSCHALSAMAEAPAPHLRFRCCSSSVVEHSLGKGEVESSILSCSTSLFLRKVSDSGNQGRSPIRQKTAEQTRNTEPAGVENPWKAVVEALRSCTIDKQPCCRLSQVSGWLSHCAPALGIELTAKRSSPRPKSSRRAFRAAYETSSRKCDCALVQLLRHTQTSREKACLGKMSAHGGRAG